MDFIRTKFQTWIELRIDCFFIENKLNLSKIKIDSKYLGMILSLIKILTSDWLRKDKSVNWRMYWTSQVLSKKNDWEYD